MTKPKASKAAIQKACDLVNGESASTNSWVPSNYKLGGLTKVLADTLQAISDDIENGADMSKWVLSKPVNPLVLKVRKAMAEEYRKDRRSHRAGAALAGDYDDATAFRAALALIRKYEVVCDGE